MTAKSLNGHSACRHAASAAIDAFLEAVAETAQRQGKPSLSLAELTRVADEFRGDIPEPLDDFFRESFEVCVNSRERDNWERSRRHPFDRLIIRRFSHMFADAGELEVTEGKISRRIIPGFFVALSKMLGTEAFEDAQRLCWKRLEELTGDGNEMKWERLDNDGPALMLLDDCLARVSQHFQLNFDRRLNWLLDTINARLMPVENEIGASDWQMDQAALRDLLRALFGPWFRRLGDADGRREAQRRLGLAAVDALEHMCRELAEE